MFGRVYKKFWPVQACDWKGAYVDWAHPLQSPGNVTPPLPNLLPSLPHPPPMEVPCAAASSLRASTLTSPAS
jgi:hypothetical protein